MKTLDAYATERHFADHIAAVWDALPAKARGRFVVHPDLVDHVAGLGIEPATAFTRTPRPVLVASIGDLRRARHAGRRHIAFIEHGIGQTYSNDHPSYPGGRGREDVGLFLVANKHAAEANRAAYPKARVAVIGCPKLDQPPQFGPHPDGRPTLAVSFHWNPMGVAPEARSAWRDFKRAIPRLTKRYRVLGHAHPRMLRKLRPWYARMGVEVLPDFADVMRRADLYICDNSSTLFEFAASGRPVVVLNARWYRKGVHHGLRFWEAAGVGINVDRALALDTAVAEALRDPPAVRRAREAALKVVYSYRSGAAKRGAKALTEWLA